MIDPLDVTIYWRQHPEKAPAGIDQVHQANAGDFVESVYADMDSTRVRRLRFEADSVEDFLAAVDAAYGDDEAHFADRD